MAADTATRYLSDDPNDDEDYFTGVPTTPENLYMVMFFFLVLYLIGDVFCSRILKIVPSLVGYILVGIAFGPEGFDVLSIGGNSNNSGNNCTVETFVVLGNLGLVLLIVQAGLEMDYTTLRLVGLRGVIIAIAGTILPVAIGTAIASRYLDDGRSAFAAGCSFGPTSAGIAMNVLGQCRIVPPPSPSSSSSPPSNSQGNIGGDSQSDNHNEDNDAGNILHLPVGQLIVAAAIVDDILALVVLSQLQALKPATAAASADETTTHQRAMDMAIPIVSAVLWLVAGGAIALWVFPKMLQELFRRIATFYPGLKEANRDGSASLVVLLVLLYALLPATYFSRASYLMGAFLSGLAFCQDSSGVDRLFRRQFQRPMSYLMKLFFAASIGFQVPVRSFGTPQIVGRGFLFSLALLGKLAVGLLTPNFYGANSSGNGDDGKPTRRFRGRHFRDCFVVGFSMMGEAEFAFVVAVFGVSEGLVPPDIYASIVWAILLSTVISPLLLKTTLAFFPYHGGVVSESTETCEKLKKEHDVSLKAMDVDSTA